MVTRPFDVFLVQLDPARGSEMQKTRPCVIVTPDDVNRYVRTVLIAPMTSVIRPFTFRVKCRFGGRAGQIALDQIRCVDHSRLLKNVGRLDPATQTAISKTLLAMFAP